VSTTLLKSDFAKIEKLPMCSISRTNEKRMPPSNSAVCAKKDISCEIIYTALTVASGIYQQATIRLSVHFVVSGLPFSRGSLIKNLVTGVISEN
jgi:hypothetical protein